MDQACNSKSNFIAAPFAAPTEGPVTLSPGVLIQGAATIGNLTGTSGDDTLLAHGGMAT